MKSVFVAERLPDTACDIKNHIKNFMSYIRDRLFTVATSPAEISIRSNQ